MDNDNNTSYSNILKGTSLLGGLQVYQIIIGVIKSKIIALLLGPAGVGILGLYSSALSMVQSFTSLGIAQSAVRDVAEAHGTNNEERVSFTVSLVRKLVWFTGFLGVCVVCIFSPLLSKTTFGSYDYTLIFVILSLTLLFDQLNAGYKVILQGTRRLKLLAKVTAYGSTIGLFIIIPFYYQYGVDGIAPSLFIYSLSCLIITIYCTKKVKIKSIIINAKTAYEQGKSIIKLGLILGLNSILAGLMVYAVRGFVNAYGSTTELGIYTAAAIIMDTYVGMVFTAINTDYYPRLAAVNKDNKLCEEICSKQGEIGALIIIPLLLSCIIYVSLIIRILYSEDFLEAANYIIAASFGMLFRFSAILLSNMFVAKGETSLFLINEFIAKIYSICLYFAGYYLYGVTGLGVAFSISYFISSIQVYIVARRKYSIKLSTEYYKIYGVGILFVFMALLIHLFLKSIYAYATGTLLLIICVIYCLLELNKRTLVLDYLKGILKNKNS